MISSTYKTGIKFGKYINKENLVHALKLHINCINSHSALFEDKFKKYLWTKLLYCHYFQQKPLTENED